MSSQRGNSEKKKAPKYTNKSGFRNNLHDTNKRTQAIRDLEIVGCCDKCTKVIEWKIKYKKYKPLTVPKKWWESCGLILSDLVFIFDK